MLGCFDRAVSASNDSNNYLGFDDANIACPSPLHRQQEDDDSIAQKADILCLGHIASSLIGFKLLMERNPDFCSSLTRACITAGDISIRSACMDAIR